MDRTWEGIRSKHFPKRWKKDCSKSFFPGVTRLSAATPSAWHSGINYPFFSLFLYWKGSIFLTHLQTLYPWFLKISSFWSIIKRHSNALSPIGPKLFWTVQIVLDRCKLFWLSPNSCGKVQIRLFWTKFYNLDLFKMIWTQPKWIGPVQNN